MSNYYINKFNTVGTYPFDRPEYGANNFYELIMNPATKIDLQNGDNIKLYNPCPSSTCIVDDTSYDIEFYKQVTIISDSLNNGIIVKLKSDGDGLKFFNGASNSSINGLRFHKDTFDGGSLIKAENTISFSIFDCEFTNDGVTNDGSAILLNGCEYVKIDSNYITTPVDGGTGGCGIELNDCLMSLIVNNTINLSNTSGVGICTSASNHKFGNYIGHNLIYNMVDSGNGINIDGFFNKNYIANNVIKISGTNSYGIISNSPLEYGQDVNIKNNVLIFEDDYSDTVGIYVPNNGSNSAMGYNIVNNIFYSESANLQNAYAISANLERDNCVVDFNMFYNINTNNLFYWGGNPLTLSGMGSKTYLTIDPLITYYSQSGFHDVSATSAYDVTSASQCLGLGIDHEHIGLYENYDNVSIYNINSYNNFIDTVTHNIGKINVINNDTFLTFFNNTFTETMEKINSDYDKAYAVDDVYENQFSWETSAGDDFPFTVNNDLYDKELIHVIKNKSDLEPFNGISCPANPGYGYSEYPDYETGIFGYTREDYINNCIVEECIIIDDITEETIWIDEIGATYIIQDAICPPCADDCA